MYSLEESALNLGWTCMVCTSLSQLISIMQLCLTQGFNTCKKMFSCYISNGSTDGKFFHQRSQDSPLYFVVPSLVVIDVVYSLRSHEWWMHLLPAAETPRPHEICYSPRTQFHTVPPDSDWNISTTTAHTLVTSSIIPIEAHNEHVGINRRRDLTNPNLYLCTEDGSRGHWSRNAAIPWDGEPKGEIPSKRTYLYWPVLGQMYARQDEFTNGLKDWTVRFQLCWEIHWRYKLYRH